MRTGARCIALSTRRQGHGGERKGDEEEQQEKTQWAGPDRHG